MMTDYFFNNGIESPQKKQETSGSFGFHSSEFSQKNNNSINRSTKKMDPSFYESSILQLNNSKSSEFIYFQNDSILGEFGFQLKGNKNSSLKQSQKQKKKNELINYSKEISFEDSLQKSIGNDDSRIKEYGKVKSTLPPTLKKPKFGFKISQTAESSAIIKDVDQSIAVNEEYQLKNNKKIQNKFNKLNQQEASKHSIHKSLRKFIKQNLVHQNKSQISSIKAPSKQPSIISKSQSESNSVNGSMNFKSVFKQKVEKASEINSSLIKYGKNAKLNYSGFSHKDIMKSLQKDIFRGKQVKMAQLKDLRELENKLGELKHQNKIIIEQMIEKDQKIEQLKKKKIEIQAEDPYAIIKENELMKAFLQAKTKRSSSNLNQGNQFGEKKFLYSAKSLKEISLKKSSQISSLHDYHMKEHKFKVETYPLTKIEKKLILSNRGMILSEKHLDVGYSLKENVLTLYLTLKREFNEVKIKLEQNSFVLSEVIDRIFQSSRVGKQIKFKTEIKSTRCKDPSDKPVHLCLKISVSSQQKFQNKMNQFKVELPITVYNIAKQLDLFSNTHLSQKTSKTKGTETFRTQTFVVCKEMTRDPQKYLLKLFPTGFFDKNQNFFQVGYIWKGKKDILKIRIKESSFVIQGEGNPNQGTFQLLRSIVSLLIESKKQG